MTEQKWVWGPINRWWTTTVLTRRGWVSLHAFPSGAWSITHKEAATDENPRGILLSSFHDGPQGANLDDAKRMALEAAEKLKQTTHAE